MFERRLRAFLILLGLLLAVFMVRLFELQILDADQYQAQAERVLIRPKKHLPFVRGDITDRNGRIIASDQPSWDICMDYGVLAGDETYMQAMIRRLQKEGRYGPKLTGEEVRERLRGEVIEAWNLLTEFTGISPADLSATRDDIRRRVQAVHDQVSANTGYEVPVVEEFLAHPIVAGLNDQQQIRARMLFGDFPFVEIRDSNQRYHHGAECVAHLIGRMGAVTAELAERDPHPDDELAKLLPGEWVGIAGVEWLAEDVLRGRRGLVQTDRDGRTVEYTAPRDGQDVRLTVDIELQNAIYETFGRHVRELKLPGGSVVVLDAATREVLALVSYPAYDPAQFNQQYAELRDDALRQPLRFRAVSNIYAPGSIFKPLTLLAGLGTGAIDSSYAIVCEGSLFPDMPDRWRELRSLTTGLPIRHGLITCRSAIMHSCNVFFYGVGERVGVAALSEWMSKIGIGRTCGAGLREEAVGVLPTPEWLQLRRNRAPSDGDARNYGVGQGEISLTTLQAANMMACYATGTYQDVALLESRVWGRPKYTLPGRMEYWDIVRGGLFDVVNDPRGTAHASAHLDDPDYVFCGKTGSAEASPWALSYRVTFEEADGGFGERIVNAGVEQQAVECFKGLYPPGQSPKVHDVRVETWYPEPPGTKDRRPSHAWFAGYLQRKNSQGLPSAAFGPEAVITVMVEFGGSGGRVSGPVAKEVARLAADYLRNRGYHTP